MKHGIPIWSTLGALLFGALGGYALGRRSSEPQPPARPAIRKLKKPAPENAIQSTSAIHPAEETERLRQHIYELERRLSRVAPTEDETRKADEIHKQIANPKAHEDLKGWLRSIGQMADLQPTMTPLFARKYRDARPRIDGAALELALAAGGPEAAALLKEIFGNPSTPKAERIAAGISLSGDGLLTRMTTNIPVDPELTQLAMSALALPDPFERQAGAGLLGLQATAQARQTLQSIAQQDRDEQIRIAAFRALARVGDRSSLDYLQTYASGAFPSLLREDTQEENLTPLERTLLQTLSRLSERFPD